VNWNLKAGLINLIRVHDIDILRLALSNSKTEVLLRKL